MSRLLKLRLQILLLQVEKKLFKRHVFPLLHERPRLTMGEEGLWERTPSGSRLSSTLSCSWCSSAKPAAMSLGTRSVSCSRTGGQSADRGRPRLTTKLPHREEVAKEPRDAGEGGAVALVLRQAAAEQPQAALPDLHRHRAGRGQELRALAALQVAHPQRLRHLGLAPGTAHRVEDDDHAHRREQQDDPAGGGAKTPLKSKQPPNRKQTPPLTWLPRQK